MERDNTCTILVTGAAGFIGSNFCHWLLENTNHRVIGVDNFLGGYPENLPEHERFIFRSEDVCSLYLDNIFQVYSPKIVYCLSCYASEGRSNHIARFIHENNTIGTTNVINCCVNHNCKLVFTSSVAVYSGMPPYDEDTIPNPIDLYGLSKLTSEKEIQIAGKVHGLEWTIVRPRNVYGVRQSLFDPSRNLMGIMFYKMYTLKPITIFGEGNHRRNFTYIDDILEPLYNAMKYDKQIFNLGAKKAWTIREAVDIFCEVTGYDNVVNVEPRHEVPFAYCNTEKSEQLLGYVDKTNLYDGLIRMHHWSRKISMRPLQTPPKLEITKNIHSSLL